MLFPSHLGIIPNVLIVAHSTALFVCAPSLVIVEGTSHILRAVYKHQNLFKLVSSRFTTQHHHVHLATLHRSLHTSTLASPTFHRLSTTTRTT
ncbi:hypothetical protein GGS23DRAFT_548753 [Durotheca rogersii]|uniref:uncharacterized protein n=1 Tax=Durotheca rogersii TaxID=419775 RepID=UPI00221E5E93|nr:uncharacterized protein GGS23DRAFT_548753 [Durotheca rogersii]KAI5867530.1 hypothetical protein GGS23DRAFT_548753 [Durotheca rogersii]